MADKALVVKSESFLERVGNLISDTAEEIEEIVTGSTGRQRQAEAHNIDETAQSGIVRVQGLEYRPPTWYSVARLVRVVDRGMLSTYLQNRKTLCDRCVVTRKGLANWKWSGYPPETIMRSNVFLMSTLDNSSCEVCSVIIRGYQTGYAGLPLPEKPVELSYSHSRLRLHHSVHDPVWDDRVDLEYHCVPDVPCPWGIFPTFPDMRPETESEARLATALQWMRACNQHERCENRGDDTPLPTRVLDVSDGLVRLIEANGRSAQYICLSHCWGGHQPLKASSSNVQSLLDGINWTEIPKTYQDTIQMVRRFGIQYLWIDSLCIIQDDPDDWTREAAGMADIYQNAYLTIAATAAKDSTSGIFTSLFCGEVSGISQAGNPYKILARPKIHHPKLWDQDTMRRRYPLLTRGWVFQEQLLSPRTLHFGLRELIWECKELLDCKCGTVGFKDRGFRKHKQLAINQGSKSRGDYQSESWREIIMSYSNLSLTFPSDKFPALAGLASNTARAKENATYVAGMWSDSLLLDLLWYVPESVLRRWWQRTPIIAKKAYLWRAPTWSWASLDGPVNYPPAALPLRTGKKILQIFCVVDTYRCVPQSPEFTMGKLLYASIRLSGKVYDGLLSLKEDKYILEVSGATFEDEIFIDNHQPPRDQSKPNSEMDWSNEPGPVVCMPLLRAESTFSFSNFPFEGPPFQPHRLEGPDTDFEVEYVLILRCKGPNYFQRIGMLHNIRRLEKTSWDAEPSCFDSSGRRETLSIV